MNRFLGGSCFEMPRRIDLEKDFLGDQQVTKMSKNIQEFSLGFRKGESVRNSTPAVCWDLTSVTSQVGTGHAVVTRESTGSSALYLKPVNWNKLQSS